MRRGASAHCDRRSAGAASLLAAVGSPSILFRPARGFLVAGSAVALAVAALPPSATAAGARPDPAFGAGRGWVTTPVAGSSALAYGAAVTAGGRIVVAGQVTNPKGNGQILVARYLPTGRLDPGFGRRGIVTTALPTAKGPFIATAVVPDRSTGRLLVAGGYGQGSILVLRLTHGGSLDRTFGAGRSGIAVVPAGGIGQSLAVQRDGRILVGGSNANRNGRPMVIARLTGSGRLDRSFGQRGLAQPLFWNPDLAASAGVAALAPTPDGGVVASGHLDYIGSDGHGSAGVVRLSSRGRLVPGFGTGGHAEVAFTKAGGGFGQWFPCAMAVDGGGRITVTGDGSLGAGAAILSTRLSARGALDPTFGSGGRAVTSGPSSDSVTTCGASGTASGGLTVGAGSALARLLPSGAPDGRFARGGVVRIAAPRGANVNAVVRAGAGRIVVAGFAGNAVYVARYLAPPA